eukprot:scaffold23427_cov68-Phaeocystis_antarctica.AAC.2
MIRFRSIGRIILIRWAQAIPYLKDLSVRRGKFTIVFRTQVNLLETRQGPTAQCRDERSTARVSDMVLAEVEEKERLEHT